MRKLMMIVAATAALSATGCVVRARPIAYHHVGPGPRYVNPPVRRAYYDYRRDDRGYHARPGYHYYP